MFSGLNGSQSVWNFGAGVTKFAGWDTPNTFNQKAWDWDWNSDATTGAGHSPCWAVGGQNSFCKWGWARTLFVFSTLNIISVFFTTFAAFSWYAEGSGGGGQGV